MRRAFGDMNADYVENARCVKPTPGCRAFATQAPANAPHRPCRVIAQASVIAKAMTCIRQRGGVVTVERKLVWVRGQRIPPRPLNGKVLIDPTAEVQALKGFILVGCRCAGAHRLGL